MDELSKSRALNLTLLEELRNARNKVQRFTEVLEHIDDHIKRKMCCMCGCVVYVYGKDVEGIKICVNCVSCGEFVCEECCIASKKSNCIECGVWGCSVCRTSLNNNGHFVCREHYSARKN
jgi:hypothetical protein